MFCIFTIAFLSIFLRLVEAGVECGCQAPGYEIKPTPIDECANAEEHSWPWIVSLWVLDMHNETHESFFKSSGTLLRVRDDLEESDIVLTTAHTTFETLSRRSMSLSGLHFRTFRDPFLTRNIRTISEAKVHEKCVNVHDHDIGLLKLSAPINFTSTIRPICLPKQGELLPMAGECYTAGWGRTDEDPFKSPDALRQLHLKVGEKCVKIKSSSKQEGHKYFCGDPLDPFTTSCTGDSGSFLACKNDGHWVQHGVISFAQTKGHRVWVDPLAFTELSDYVDWIEKNKKEMSSLTKVKMFRNEL